MEIALFDKEKNKNLRQSNFLIEARYKLTLQEFRIITIIMSMISQNDEDFKEYKINLSDIRNLLDITSDNLVPELKKATKGLLSKPLVILSDNKTIQMNWISSAKYEKGKTYVIVKLDPELKPYLLKIKSYYTEFELQELLSLKSFYSSRIYELMKQFTPTIPKRTFDVDELQEILGCNYPNYGNFKDRVLKSAILEINNKTGLAIDFEEKKQGKKVVKIIFNIRVKSKLPVTEKKEVEISTIQPLKNIDTQDIKDLRVAIRMALNLKFGSSIDQIFLRIFKNAEIIKNGDEYLLSTPYPDALEYQQLLIDKGINIKIILVKNND